MKLYNMEKIPGSILMVTASMLLMGYTRYAQKLLPELEPSLDLVEESWTILDKITNEVWPEWDNYKEISYFTAVPMKQDLFINPPSDPKNDFEFIQTKIYPIKVYLRAPCKREKVWGGAYRYE